jgi:hypothetical protein
LYTGNLRDQGDCVTTADVSSILTALSELSIRVHEVVERLARIEERTTVLTDHEVRIRAAEEAARIAGEHAAIAKTTAESQLIRIEALEIARQLDGKFSLGVLGKVVVSSVGLVVSVTGMALAFQQLFG